MTSPLTCSPADKNASVNSEPEVRRMDTEPLRSSTRVTEPVKISHVEF